jgi:hypothetical protein
VPRKMLPYIKMKEDETSTGESMRTLGKSRMGKINPNSSADLFSQKKSNS